MEARPWPTPLGELSRLLAAKIGIPYFLLSTTGPLMQAWYTRNFKGAMPYRLYALSNIGSMFALLSYPFLFEPVFPTSGRPPCGPSHTASSSPSAHHRLRAGQTSETLEDKPNVGQALSPADPTEAETPPTPPPLPATIGFWLALPLSPRPPPGYHQSPFTERSRHPFPLGAAFEHLPLVFHPVLRWRLYWRNPYLQLLAVALAAWRIASARI